ncbi:unnamed protein product [Trichogramma brassicae]|uniref:Uncharacterized protein n=1 Tax=Trichogramma brassicae TaxID=86971 RepID=A0A6H5I3Q3_9HYME|nr:unnamed protein product [Trichogramma brassicae]
MASSNTIADATTTIKALNARSAPHPSRMRSTCFITARGSAKKERDYTPCSTRFTDSYPRIASRFLLTFHRGLCFPLLMQKTRARAKNKLHFKNRVIVKPRILDPRIMGYSWAGSDWITISRSPRRGLTRLAIDGAQYSHDEVRSENHTHKRAPDAGAKAQQERMMAPEARTTLTR